MAILEAIRNRKPDAAREAMRAHLEMETSLRGMEADDPRRGIRAS